MIRAICGHSTSLYDKALRVTLYTALAWGSGKTQLGLQCLRQFYLQEKSLLEYGKSLLEYGFGETEVQKGKKMYLSHVDLKDIGGKKLRSEGVGHHRLGVWTAALCQNC
eukprot:gb/GECG01009341.1/.p1 GENE.gb/GECG01009341.1/~~gb/GECG01009341.1/.p1  ORF type:complete len:109 (+),score=12.27 gb/GECG01009341.1/:1-327(+)